MTWDHGGGKDSCCKRGADRRVVCDGQIGVFHMGGGGLCKSANLLHYCICAYLSALFSVDPFFIFLMKFHGCQVWLVGWLWCYHFMVGVHCFADIDQADLLGGVGELLG